MCGYYGLKFNFYDITMHGVLDLFKPLPHLKTFLAEDLKGRTLAILNNDFTVSSTSQNTVNAWSLEFLKKEQVIKAAGDFDVHFIVFSPHPHNFISWGLHSSENPRTYPNPDEFIKAEYDFQENQPFGVRIGSSDMVNIDKAAISFKSKQDQLLAESTELLDKVQKRFPYQNYVGCPIFKEVAGSKQIG